MPAAEFQAHGCHVQLNGQQLRLRYSVLQRALGASDQHLLLNDAQAINQTAQPTATTMGELSIADVRIPFAPGAQKEQQRCLSALQAAAKGELAPIVVVPGLDFLAVDVETANADWGSICQIGVCQVRDGAVVAQDAWLCKPPAKLDSFEDANIAIHGITAEDVADAPNFSEAMDKLESWMDGSPLLAHNAQFDMTALRRACIAADIEVPAIDFGCSLALARAAKLDVINHRLPTVAKALDVMLQRHHDAGADAEACAGIVIALAQRKDIEGDLGSVMHGFGFQLGHLDASKVYPVLRDRNVDANDDVEIAALTPEQSRKPKKPRQPWAKVATPDEIPEANTEADPAGNLFGQTVVLSGDFEPYSKGQLWSAMAQQGAHVAKNVTKKTTILVSGPWKGKTSKLKRAEELQAQGQKLEIWSKEELVTQLGLEEDPPF